MMNFLTNTDIYFLQEQLYNTDTRKGSSKYKIKAAKVFLSQSMSALKKSNFIQQK